MNQARENNRPLKLENGRTIFRRCLKVNSFGPSPTFAAAYSTADVRGFTAVARLRFGVPR